MNLFETAIDRNAFFIYISLLKLEGARVEDCENPYTHEDERCVVIPIRDNLYTNKWGTVALSLFAHPLDYPTDKRSHIINPPFIKDARPQPGDIITPKSKNIGYLRIFNSHNKFFVNK